MHKPSLTNVNPAVDRITACEGKQGFADRQIALGVAKRILRRDSGGRHSQVSVYRCAFCRQWHVGNTPYRIRGKKP